MKKYSEMQLQLEKNSQNSLNTYMRNTIMRYFFREIKIIIKTITNVL